MAIKLSFTGIAASFNFTSGKRIYRLKVIVVVLIYCTIILFPITLPAILLIISGLKDKHKSKQNDKNKQN